MFPVISVIQTGNGNLGTSIKDVEERHLDVGPISLEVNTKGSKIIKKYSP